LALVDLIGAAVRERLRRSYLVAP